MKQVLQNAHSGEISVAAVPAPQLMPGCALVRMAASVVSAGTETVRSRWQQNKGHREEWAAFAEAVQGLHQPPIAFEDIVCSTLATLRIDRAIATGERLDVDVRGFLEDAQRKNSNRDE